MWAARRRDGCVNCDNELPIPKFHNHYCPAGFDVKTLWADLPRKILTFGDEEVSLFSRGRDLQLTRVPIRNTQRPPPSMTSLENWSPQALGPWSSPIDYTAEQHN
jgi:hypothetical protein